MLNQLGSLIALALLAAAGYPILAVWRPQRRTSLRHASGWLALAWFGWMAALIGKLAGVDSAPLLYAVICGTAAPAVAVFGARLPGMVGWNFVVAGLLAVLLFPLASLIHRSDGWSPDEPTAIFAGLVFLVAAINYLPTRYGYLAGSLALVSWIDLAVLTSPARWPGAPDVLLPASAAALGLALWIGLALSGRRHAGSDEFRGRWLAFRDRYGVVWARRVIDQFNRSSAAANFGVTLGWNGFEQQGDDADSLDVSRLFGRLMKRFEPTTYQQLAGEDHGPEAIRSANR